MNSTINSIFCSIAMACARTERKFRSWEKRVSTCWRDISTLSCLIRTYTWRGEPNGSVLLVSGWLKLQQLLVFTRCSTILASMILKRQKNACAPCAGDGGKVTRASRHIDNSARNVTSTQREHCGLWKKRKSAKISIKTEKWKYNRSNQKLRIWAEDAKEYQNLKNRRFCAPISMNKTDINWCAFLTDV